MVEDSKIKRSVPWLRRLCWALLVVHASWVCVHAYFHYKDYLNPWKLGGYAMYTRPQPHFFAKAALLGETGQIISYLPKRIGAFHSYAMGGCLGGIQSSFYEWFLVAQYEKIKGKRLKFEFFESTISMSAEQKITNTLIGSALVSMTESGDFLIKENFCDSPRELFIDVVE